ncbi:MAG: glycosyltransferase family 39 protein [Acidobacteria bacterium]|nr:glycosyltransferase family 39 protein [Acidobacteriota bacterium]
MDRATQSRPEKPSVGPLAALSPRLYLVFILALFAVVAVAVVVTRSPWFDEGMLADPAHNLARSGMLGSTVASGKGHPFVRDFVGYDRYTFWTVPLYLVVLAGWIKLFGFSIISVRLLSVILAGGLVLTAYFIVSRLTESRVAGLTAALLVGTDYTVTLSAATARMDMMAAALGFGALAVYLALRERTLNLAAFASGALAAASCYTHPVGLLHSGGLALTALYLDRRRLRLTHFALAAVPYLVFTVLWAVYIAQAPRIFLAQIEAHAGYRLGGLASPVKAILGDLRYRYVWYFMPQQAGVVGRFKFVILLGYFGGILAAALIPRLRRAPGVKLLLLLAVLYYVELALLDGNRVPHYMVHVITMWALLLGAVVGRAWSRGLLSKPTLAAVLGGLIIFQIAGSAIKIKSNTYRNDYLKMIAFVREHSTPDSLVMGPSEMQFALGADRRLVDDARLGGLTGASPDVVVLGPMGVLGPQPFETREPDMASHVSEVLTRLHLSASYGVYKVYLPAGTGESATATSRRPYGYRSH